MADPAAWARLAQIALQLIDAGVAERVATALEDGELRRDSGSASRDRIVAGSVVTSRALTELLTAWTALGEIDGATLAASLRGTVAGVRAERQLSPKTELVWTGPGVEGSRARATQQVINEIIDGAERELLIVGYWLVVWEGDEGVVSEIIDRAVEAARRGATVTIILDPGMRDDTDNRAELDRAWPSDAPQPRVLTWRPPAERPGALLHAKVIVADTEDALVTSANLTHSALTWNLEVGLRVSGDPAARVAEHFGRLREQGLLEPL